MLNDFNFLCLTIKLLTTLLYTMLPFIDACKKFKSELHKDEEHGNQEYDEKHSDLVPEVETAQSEKDAD